MSKFDLYARHDLPTASDGADVQVTRLGAAVAIWFLLVFVAGVVMLAR